MANGETLRRRPAQRRSVERVERMLDECARLLDEVGLDALTTKEVARRAGVPIGTFYQFFPDKQGLVRALAARSLELLLARFIARLAEADAAHWTDVTDLGIDEFAAMKRDTPGFGAIDLGAALGDDPVTRAGERLFEAVREQDAAVADRLRALLGGPAGADLDRALLVTVEAAGAVLKFAFRAAPEGDPALIEECKRLARRYLADRLPQV
ncbi:TetR family transcriptional regulator [Microtetraspora sp. NBRC 13810]|uniref:TetR/AcrR family transcriptional regulator n=1 Tax=Microtetraspora sp. NBRC 13810 TaxID=3030990 RepID=UPI0024A3D012|nr:TetR/AcrR family transcriptional regulator [Microtetraspora sp. NBRC 13810]GLW06051.1 TetR family transcriptional regulator [Microtetraspora sp. NBRC 13810]